MIALARILVPISLLLLLTLDLSAQRRRTPQPLMAGWIVEPDFRVALLKDDEVTFLGARIGPRGDLAYDDDEILLFGSLFVLTEGAELRRPDGSEKVKAFGYLGPSLEYSDWLRGPVRYFFRGTIGVGLALQEHSDRDGATRESGLFVGFEPEAGLLVRATRRFQITLGTGFLLGRIVGNGQMLSSAPSATFGVRWIH